MSSSEKAERLKAEGSRLFATGKYEKALNKYKEACRLCPSVPVYRSNAAACYEKLKKFKKMKHEAEKCIQADDTFVKGYYRLAQAQQKLKEFSESLETLNRALELDKDNEDLLLLKLEAEHRLQLLKCLNCGTPTKSVCDKCQSAPYCSVTCQKEHRSIHKLTCVEPGAVDVHKCENCLKRVRTSSRLICPECNRESYCSRGCLLEHRPRHELGCKANKAFDESVEQNEMITEWHDRAKELVGLLATHAMTKKQFMEQPPDFVIEVAVQFNYNFMSYLPRNDPETTSIQDLPDHLRERVRDRLQASSTDPEVYNTGSILHHVYILECFHGSEMVGGFVGPFMLEPSHFQCATVAQIAHELHSEKFNLNPRLMDSWDDRYLASDNLDAQIRALQTADNRKWTSFLAHSLRVYSKEPLHKTHVVVVDFAFGFGLGEIKALNSYELMELTSLHDIYREEVSPDEAEFQHYFDVEHSPKLLEARRTRPQSVLLAVVFRGGGFRLSPQSGTLFQLKANVPRLTQKRCKERADECFRHLQSVSLPEVSSPDLPGQNK